MEFILSNLNDMNRILTCLTNPFEKINQWVCQNHSIFNDTRSATASRNIIAKQAARTLCYTNCKTKHAKASVLSQSYFGFTEAKVIYKITIATMPINL